MCDRSAEGVHTVVHHSPKSVYHHLASTAKYIIYIISQCVIQCHAINWWQFRIFPFVQKTSILRSVGADWGGRPALSPGLVGTKVSPSATLGSAGVLQRVVTQPVRCAPLCCCLFVMFCLSICLLPPQNWIAQHKSNWLNWNSLILDHQSSKGTSRGPNVSASCYCCPFIS